jgi:hypothetical protein
MRVAWVMALAVAISSLADGATMDAADAWRPMSPFIGTWKGTRAGANGPVKVTRVYASAPTNQYLEITEKVDGRPKAVWGVVSFDREHQVLVLRQFAADGSAFDVVFDPSSASTEPLVFASNGSEASRTRIVYERGGTKGFVERIERSAGGEPIAVVSETRFERKD